MKKRANPLEKIMSKLIANASETIDPVVKKTNENTP